MDRELMFLYLNLLVPSRYYYATVGDRWASVSEVNEFRSYKAQFIEELVEDIGAKNE